ncbi:hypothetical protein CD798_09860 [Bacillaceae bacterium SAOS 7]|nr:hypothetical protein CD798_09860 [Bacillaceae bacterium SAOS 7]
MENLKILKVEINDEMPLESAIIFYRFLEKILLDNLPDTPVCKGLFLSQSLAEFNNIDDLEVRKKDDRS